VASMSDPVTQLRGAVSETAAALAGNGRVAPPKLDRPPRPDFGDYSTNAAMLLAPSLGEPPRAVAERLGDALGERLGPSVAKVEVAGPGFLNLFMADAWYLDSLARMREAGERFGAGEAGERLNVEFVSANPTGPMHVGHARHAAFGDALCRILEFAGHEVEREFYVNDHGTQIRKFGESILARARGEEPEEYKGDYVAELAERIEGAAELDPDELAQRGMELMLDGIRASFDRFRVRMDRFFSERSLQESGEVEAALARLDGVYEHDSPPTSPTTCTSSAAATNARSTSGARTTTDTRAACGRPGRRSEATATASSS
jgi:arginyl-tRNA synthetase